MPWHARFAQELVGMMLVGAQTLKRMELAIFWEQEMVNDISEVYFELHCNFCSYVPIQIWSGGTGWACRAGRSCEAPSVALPEPGRGKGLDLTKAKALKPCSLHDQQQLESHVQSSGDKKPHQPPLFQPSVNTERTCSQMYSTA